MKYELETELGRGATGVVWRARSAGGETVAVKVAPDGRTQATLLQRLDHPNIVRVIEVVDDTTTVIEYAAGRLAVRPHRVERPAGAA